MIPQSLRRIRATDRLARPLDGLDVRAQCHMHCLDEIVNMALGALATGALLLAAFVMRRPSEPFAGNNPLAMHKILH